MILVVGERMNVQKWTPRTPTDFSSDRYWELQKRLGAFRDDRSRSALLRVGLDLRLSEVQAVNLLLPDQQTVPFDKKIAKIVATNWMSRIEQEFETVILCGRRVADAFECERLGKIEDCCGDVAIHQGMPSVSTVIIPHPSGLNLWWNDQTRVDRLREKMESMLCRRE